MVNKLYLRLSRIYNSDRLPWIIIGIGIMLRLVRYLQNPSLYFDEAGIAADYAKRPITDLINLSTDSTSTYPLSFQVVIKIAMQLLGNTEYSLRLHALIFGIASLFLFYYVAKKYISPKVVPATLLLYAILNSLVYYSSIVKPYSGDVFFALLIYVALIYCQSKNFDLLRTLLFAFCGAIIIWLSNPSIFVLAGVGISVITFYFVKKEWILMGRIVAVCSAWTASFVLYYVVFLNNMMTSVGDDVDALLKKESAFIPFPPATLADIKWYIDTFFDTFNLVDPTDFKEGLTLTGIAALLFVCGCVFMYSKNKQRFFTLVSPIFVTLAAAALHIYPFRGRLILFLVPIFLLTIAEGIVYIHEKTRNNSKAIITLIVIFLFIYPVSWAAYNVKKPVSREDIRPVLQHIEDNWHEGDILYVHFYAQYAFEYYTKIHPEPFHFSEDECVIGIAPRGWYRTWRRDQVSRYYDASKPIKQSSRDILGLYIKDLDQLMGHKRAWILFAEDISSTPGMKDSAFFLYYLDTKGKRLDYIQNVSSAYLYDLSGKYKISE